jgi:glycine/D-amino acid oxidase-like deaminating enzyme/nitrite reductase/ring-hydroxylating ferredoxin subunit
MVTTSNGQSTSVWMATAVLPPCGPLDGDAQADVCVVGAGIAGLTTAYNLVRAGRRVLVLDSGALCAGQTQRTTAHLSNEIDDRYLEIERYHGAEGARLAAQSHGAAIDFIEETCQRENIDCDFRRLDGYLFAPPDEKPGLLAKERDAARRAGLDADLVGSPLSFTDLGPCLRFPRQGQFHPLRYLAGLADRITGPGGRICTHTHVKGVAGGRPAKVTTADGKTVTCDAVVVATNSPINDQYVIHTKQAPYISYVIAGRVPRDSVPYLLLWDTPDPYHYVRLQPEPDGAHDLLIVGGEDHKTGQADDLGERWAALERWTRRLFPMFQTADHRWSGQVMETIDGLAYIGRNPRDADNVFVATGDSGMGMTHGTIAGLLIPELIQGRDHPWAKLYDPSRKTLRAAAEYLSENLNVVGQYGAWLTPGEVHSIDEIPPGGGALVRRGLKKVAVYRDAEGVTHERSAACPHLGCIVEWNADEKTWDCPCHGSRFDCLGRVINGPSNADLAEAPKAEEARTPQAAAK